MVFDASRAGTPVPFRPRSVDDVAESSFEVFFELAFVPVQTFVDVAKVSPASVGLVPMSVPGPLGLPILGVAMMKDPWLKDASRFVMCWVVAFGMDNIANNERCMRFLYIFDRHGASALQLVTYSFTFAFVVLAGATCNLKFRFLIAC
jgi:hypothetical protein